MTACWFLENDAPVTLDWSALWREVIRRYGDLNAIRWNGENLTYGELARQADRFAGELQSNPNWRRGCRIALSTLGPSYWWQSIGVWLAEGVLLPYNESLLEADPALKERIDALTECRVDRSGQYTFQDFHPFQGDETWHAIYFTSGSTGTPKAVVRGWSQALYEAVQYAAILNLSPGIRCSMLIDPSFGASTKHFLGCLLSGCSQDFPFMEEFPVASGDVLYGTPSQIASFASRSVKSEGYSWISLTGEACSASSWKAMGQLTRKDGHCLNALGGSEFGVLLNQVVPIGKSGSSLPSFRGKGLSGKKLAIIDGDGIPCAEGVAGLIKVTSPWIAEGYLEMKAGTPALSRFGKPGDEAEFLTGDVAMVDGEEFMHLGRSAGLLKIHGRWVDITPLKKALMESSLPIADVHVDVSLEKAGLRLWIEPENFDSGIPEEVMHFLIGEFGRSALMPAEINILRSIPRNRNDKADLNRLATGLDSVDQDGRIRLLPQSRVAFISAAIIQGDFSSPLFRGVGDLKDLNLDSLEMHELASLLGKALRRDISMESLLSLGNLEDLAGKLKDSGLGGFSIMGSPDSSNTLIFWIGSGIGTVFQTFGGSHRIHHWDYHRITEQNGVLPGESMQGMAQRLLRMSPLNGMRFRILVGGFSFGAVAAHEIALQLSREGHDVIGSILLDPPDMTYRTIRNPWRWSRWKPFLLLTMLKPFTGGLNGTIRLVIQQRISRERERCVTEKHRSVLRHTALSSSPVKTWLFTCTENHQKTTPLFEQVLSRPTVVPLSVHLHADVLQDVNARRTWVGKMLDLLK
jgi:acyl-coenzyme A synthetase/AMP-(fatty) acid ligase